MSGDLWCVISVVLLGFVWILRDSGEIVSELCRNCVRWGCKITGEGKNWADDAIDGSVVWLNEGCSDGICCRRQSCGHLP